MRTRTSRRALLASPLAASALHAQDLLSKAETELLAALCEQIIPADQDPGARETGAVRFIAKQLAGPHKRHLAAYRQGLREIRPDFLQLSFDEQTAYLKTIESTPFFQLLIDHTMQSYYGHPHHGGNRDGASWKMLRIDTHMGEGHWHGPQTASQTKTGAR